MYYGDNIKGAREDEKKQDGRQMEEEGHFFSNKGTTSILVCHWHEWIAFWYEKWGPPALVVRYGRWPKWESLKGGDPREGMSLQVRVCLPESLPVVKALNNVVHRLGSGHTKLGERVKTG